MTAPSLDRLPGFRRRFIVTTGPGWVRGDVEDDYHGMAVTIRHEGGRATAIEPEMSHVPWTTCPGATARLVQTFTDVPLEAFGVRGDKSSNCTHLHDLAVLAAAHARDSAPLVYDILVSDPDETGTCRAELRKNGETIMSWAHVKGRFVTPAALEGVTLDKMNPFINSLDAAQQEAVRLLRWGTMLAHGRALSIEKQLDAGRAGGRCFTFQPHIVGEARRLGEIRDFSGGTVAPLAERTAFLADSQTPKLAAVDNAAQCRRRIS